MNTEKISQITTKTFTPPHPLKTAVLFMVFKRPDTTKQVFEAIRQAKPPRLYVAADGPRDDKAGEAEKVEQARRIAMQVDWECEVKTLFRDKNLGCRVGVSTAIDWFFENEEEGIILEDDCLPSQSFFWFCEELLERYRGDLRVMMIGGNNKGVNFLKDCSYFFSKYVQIWGWATWRRSWEKYDYKIKKWELIKEQISNYIYSPKEIKIRIKQFDSVYNNKLDTWDFQWNFTCLINHGLSILPSLNMISNIMKCNYH
ncbi:MAG: hypothetical protein JRE23_13855 [Deltaproteobacteria bacterium]|nr:hypothetical protein [Deltaproteobacteria bacterium]